MNDAKTGVIDISKSEWLRFLYPQDTACDLDNDQAGLFRGYLLPTVHFNLIYAETLIEISL
jgi:hypothetical protein